MAPFRARSRRSSRLWSAWVTASNSSRDALPLSVWAARKMEEISSRSSGRLSSSSSDSSICARSSSVSSRNDCSNISRLISIDPLQICDERFARCGMKDDPLAPVLAYLRVNDWNALFGQCFHGRFDVAFTQAILARFGAAHRIKQASSAEHFSDELLSLCACFRQLLEQGFNGNSSVSR